MTSVQHGTRSFYTRGCRCDDCRRANARAYALWALRGTNLVDSTPVREHIAKLRAQGLGKRGIAEQAGVGLTCINRLGGGDKSRPANRVRPDIAARILAVTADRLQPSANVPATGTMRRLRALIAIGWTQTELGSRMGWTKNNLGALVWGRYECVQQRTADAVAALFEGLSATPGPSIRARAYARRHGWLPPLAWDNIDDPNEQPNPKVVRRNTDAILTDEDLFEMLANGETLEAIAARYGKDINTLKRKYLRARVSAA